MNKHSREAKVGFPSGAETSLSNESESRCRVRAWPRNENCLLVVTVRHSGLLSQNSNPSILPNCGSFSQNCGTSIESLAVAHEAGVECALKPPYENSDTPISSNRSACLVSRPMRGLFQLLDVP
jgi:hypothetical protein